jgi:hypothetical protein
MGPQPNFSALSIEQQIKHKETVHAYLAGLKKKADLLIQEEEIKAVLAWNSAVVDPYRVILASEKYTYEEAKAALEKYHTTEQGIRYPMSSVNHTFYMVEYYRRDLEKKFNEIKKKYYDYMAAPKEADPPAAPREADPPAAPSRSTGCAMRSRSTCFLRGHRQHRRIRRQK